MSTKYTAKISEGNFMITIKGSSDDISMDDFFNNVQKAWNAIKTDDSKEPNVKIFNDSKEIKSDINFSNINRESDEFRIRKRIPNNVIDPSELSFKNAVSENAFVRCPHCGQSFTAFVDIKSEGTMYMLRKNYDKKCFDCISKFDDTKKNIEMYSTQPNTKYNEYFKAVYELKEDASLVDNDLVVENDTEIFCPLCWEHETFEQWKQAYESPLDFFETEKLCDICGGDLVLFESKDKEKDSTVYKCEMCGTIIPENGMPRFSIDVE